MLHLTFRDQVADGPCHVFHRNAGIDPMLIEQVDAVRAQPAQRLVGNLADALRPAVDTFGRPTIPETKLGRDHNVVAKRFDSLTEQFFVRPGPRLRQYRRRNHSAFEGCPDEVDTVITAHAGAETVAQAHTTEANCGHLKVASAEFTLLHVCLPFARGAGSLSHPFETFKPCSFSRLDDIISMKSCLRFINETRGPWGFAAFLAVAEEQSFTRAAARLGTSQSALSHTIRRSGGAARSTPAYPYHSKRFDDRGGRAGCSMRWASDARDRASAGDISASFVTGRPAQSGSPRPSMRRKRCSGQ